MRNKWLSTPENPPSSTTFGYKLLYALAGSGSYTKRSTYVLCVCLRPHTYINVPTCWPWLVYVNSFFFTIKWRRKQTKPLQSLLNLLLQLQTSQWDLCLEGSSKYTAASLVLGKLITPLNLLETEPLFTGMLSRKISIVLEAIAYLRIIVFSLLALPWWYVKFQNLYHFFLLLFNVHLDEEGLSNQLQFNGYFIKNQVNLVMIVNMSLVW